LAQGYPCKCVLDFFCLAYIYFFVINMYKGASKGYSKGTDMGLGGKAAPSQRTPTPEEIEKNQIILDALLPSVAAKIDGNGGVLSVKDLCEMQDIKDQIAQIPHCFPRSLPTILSQWTDFFVMMSYGLVGTAIGYDTGLIQADGTLDPAFESTFLPLGKRNYKEYVEPTMMQAPKRARVESFSQPIDLAEATAELTRLCYILEDDASCETAFQRVQIARKQKRGERITPKKKSKSAANNNPIPNPHVPGEVYNFSHLTREQKCIEILNRVFEKLKSSPNNTQMLNAITQDDAIRELKKQAVMSFVNWFKSFPENFLIENVAGTTEFQITLLSDVMPSQPAPVGQGGKGKGRRY